MCHLGWRGCGHDRRRDLSCSPFESGRGRTRIRCSSFAIRPKTVVALFDFESQQPGLYLVVRFLISVFKILQFRLFKKKNYSKFSILGSVLT